MTRAVLDELTLLTCALSVHIIEEGQTLTGERAADMQTGCEPAPCGRLCQISLCSSSTPCSTANISLSGIGAPFAVKGASKEVAAHSGVQRGEGFSHSVTTVAGTAVLAGASAVWSAYKSF